MTESNWNNISNSRNSYYSVFNMIMFIIFFTIFQDLFCAILYYAGIPAFLLKLVYYSKEVMIILTGLYCLLSLMRKWMWHLKVSEMFVLIFCLNILVFVVIGAARNGLYNSVLGSRQYIVPIMMLAIGVYIGQSCSVDKMLNKLISKINKLSIFLIITTIIERFMVPIHFWQSINMVQFSNAIKGNNGYYVNSGATLIENFYTSGVRRAVGVAAEPLLLSYYMIPLFFFSLAIYLLSESKKRRILGILISLGVIMCQILTITRAIVVAEILAWVVCLIFPRVRIGKVYSKKKISIYVIIGVIFFAVGFDAISSVIYKTLNNLDGGSAGMHFYQLQVGLNYIKQYWYGIGIGSGSNVVSFSGTTNLATEFAYSNITVDMSFVGTILYISILIRYSLIFAKDIRYYQNKQYRILAFTNVFCIVTWLITGFFSPQMWGMKSVLLTWMLIGIGRGISLNKTTIG